MGSSRQLRLGYAMLAFVRPLLCGVWDRRVEPLSLPPPLYTAQLTGTRGVPEPWEKHTTYFEWGSRVL